MSARLTARSKNWKNTLRKRRKSRAFLHRESAFHFAVNFSAYRTISENIRPNFSYTSNKQPAF